MEIINSKSNEKLKAVRALRQHKARQESGLFIVEGIRHVGEAIEAGARLSALYYAPDDLRSEYGQRLVSEQTQAGVPCYAVAGAAFESLSDKDNPQGLLAVVHQPRPSLQALTPANFAWGVALVAPQDPGNLGTILRTVDAVGAGGVLLLDSTLDAYQPAVVRASMGAIFWHPPVEASFDEFLAWAQQHDYTLYGTSAHASRDYRQISAYRSPRILLMGSEREGLSSAQLEACNERLRLPMLGRATSLNLAVATGVLLYAMLSE